LQVEFASLWGGKFRHHRLLPPAQLVDELRGPVWFLNGRGWLPGLPLASDEDKILIALLITA
jgi:hypothetical protein